MEKGSQYELTYWIQCNPNEKKYTRSITVEGFVDHILSNNKQIRYVAVYLLYSFAFLLWEISCYKKS